MAAPVIFDGRAGHFRWPRRSFSMADGRAGHFRWPRRSFSMAIDGFDGRAGRFRWLHTYIHTITPVIFDGRAGHFRWPRRSFSMAAPVAAMAAPVAAIATHLCPYEVQYITANSSVDIGDIYKGRYRRYRYIHLKLEDQL